MFETMAWFMLVEHANGAMFDPPLGPAVHPQTVAPTASRTAPATTWFSRTSGRVTGPAPHLGADTAEVLQELGLAPAAGEAAAHGSASRGVGARQQISAAAAPCLPLMRTAPT